MITAKLLEEVNKNLATIEITRKKKGGGVTVKPYVCVPARIQGFRKMCPDGSITTEIISLQDGVVVMKASVFDETGKLLATGTAYEKEQSSLINMTSYIEVAETSAIGRALGILGIGIDAGLASAEEMVTAMTQQSGQAIDMDGPITGNEKKVIEEMCKARGLQPESIFGGEGKPGWPNISGRWYVWFMHQIEKWDQDNGFNREAS